MFGSKARREAIEKEQTETLLIENDKLAGQWRECLAVADPAERYLAIAGFAADMDARVRQLAGGTQEKTAKRRHKNTLAAASPLALLALCEPITLTVTGVATLLGSGLVTWVAPYSWIQDSFKNSDVGGKKVRREVMPYVELATKYLLGAREELPKIAGEHLGELAL